MKVLAAGAAGFAGSAICDKAAPDADTPYHVNRPPAPQSLYGIGKHAAGLSLRRLVCASHTPRPDAAAGRLGRIAHPPKETLP